VNLLDGFTNIIERSELEVLIAKGEGLRIKAGFDPTAPDLHLGHAVLLNKLRQFQDQNPRTTVVMIVGTATAAIGDPTGRNKLRPPLTDAQIEANASTYLSQAFKILKREQTVVRPNGMWFNEMKMKDVIRLMSNFTLSQVTTRDEFRDRQKECTPIFMHELLYPIMQAYDSFREGVDLELGGSDQFYNMMMGRMYMDARNEKPQIIATVPILVGLDGKNKMSKSMGNHIGLTEAAFEMFSKVMSVSDETADSWWRTLFTVDEPEFVLVPPYRRKLDLANRIVSWLHSPEIGEQCETEWRNVFGNRQKPSDIPMVAVTLDDQSSRLDRILVLAGLAKSMSDAGRLIKSGAVDVNGINVKTTVLETPLTEMAEIRVGRKWTKISQAK
jgi:tyrosyl-tRNA synthetase